MSIQRLVMAALALVLASTGCARLGPLQSGLGTTLHGDLAHGFDRGPGAPGTFGVDAEGISLRNFPIVLYRPRGLRERAPGVVFLPGKFAPEDQYESYARSLASHGIVVAVRGRYSWFHSDEALANDAVELANWLRERPYVDPARIALAGHSMGGRDSIRAASTDPRFRAIVAIDPGTIAKLPNAREVLANLHVPLLLIGADEAWRGLEFCGRRETNYTAYFATAPAGTLEFEIHGADHVQVMDRPDDLGYSVCRVGSADSTSVRSAARTTVVEFLRERLLGDASLPLRDYGRLATWRRRPAESLALPTMPPNTIYAVARPPAATPASVTGPGTVARRQ